MSNGKRRESESGVALIVVLGFLSLMLIMAVAFLQTAVTEETVSDFSQEAIRSRQVLRSAVAAAMNDYSRDLWKAKLYLPDEDYEVFASESSGMDAIPGNAGTLKGSQLTLMRGEALDWIPARYRTKETTNLVDNAEWILVREDPGAKSRILGRYAYVCFDCSGALDGNYVALVDDVGKGDSRALSNRVRRSIRDVPMGMLPELADAGQFNSYRRGWKGFDSPQMLMKLTDGKAEDGNGSSARWQTDRKENYGAGLVSNLVSEVTSYSLSAYRGGRYSRSSGTWEAPKYIDPSTGSGWQKALDPLRKQLKVDDASIEKMIKDFTSANSKAPEGVDYPSVKNIPMFNEVIVSGLKFTRQGPTVNDNGDNTYTYSAELKIQFEYWYPFPSEDDDAAGTITLTAPTLSMCSSPGSANFAMPVALMVGSKIVQVAGEAVPTPAQQEIPVKWNGGKPYVTEAFTYKVNFTPKDGSKITADDAKLMWAQGLETKAPLELTRGGEAVDRLPSGLTWRIGGRVVIGVNETHGEKYVKEALDPRLNHLTADWQDAASDDGTPGDINSCTEGHIEFKREGTAMYCRNGKFETPADFGFFPTGEPWKTIDLLCDDGAEFLALTTMDENIKEAMEANKAEDRVFYTNAQLNINTRCSNALASAFYEIPTLEVPNVPKDNYPAGENYWDEDTAREFARLIMEVTGKEPYQSGMDWAALPAMKQNGWLAAKGLNRNQRESLLRNTYGLFSVADSLFLAVVVAQSVKEGPDKVGSWDDEDQITGERRGVALVWRDPFKTGNNHHHEMMVRMFRYLND